MRRSVWNTPKKTYVLVHGAWHGGWCWSRVSCLLREEGHQVFAITLTGLGERSHLLTPEVSLDTHITDVANLIECEELDQVVLVGHSYGGLIITGASDRVPCRIAARVHLDAFVPRDGNAWKDFHSQDIQKAIGMSARFNEKAWIIPPPEPARLGITGPDSNWLSRRMTPHPFSTYSQPIHLANLGGQGFPLIYIACTKPELDHLAIMRARIEADRSWSIFKLATGHDAMITAAEQLAALLGQLG
jgi:pimeloyl-ACP methyl ester carboxylesterase